MKVCDLAALALFDFDGTISDQDMFTAFLLYAAPKHRLALGRLLLAPEIYRYQHLTYPAAKLRPKLAGFAFKRMSQSVLQRKGQQFSAKRIPPSIRSEARARLDWHQCQGDKIVVVSASLSVYLRPWCQANGFDLLCSELEFVNGRASGCYATPDCSSDEKVNRIRLSHDLSAYDSVYAYGDTPEDHAMLALADVSCYQWQ